MPELILALDLDKEKEIKEWLSLTKDYLNYYKIGIRSFVKIGPKSVRLIKKFNKKVFLDLKFFDIPNSMIKAGKNAIDLGVDLLNFHLLNEESSLKGTIKELKSYSEKKGKKVLFLGVTLLTSINFKKNIEQRVLKLAKKARSIGFDGVICAGRESKIIKETLGNDFITACPGIRFEPVSDDQKRVSAPQRIKKYVDFFIMGRPILESKDPLKTIKKILRLIR